MIQRENFAMTRNVLIMVIMQTVPPYLSANGINTDA